MLMKIICKKQIELGRVRIILVKINNKNQIELGRWRIIQVKINNKKQIELRRWRIILVKIINKNLNVIVFVINSKFFNNANNNVFMSSSDKKLKYC